MSYHVGSNKTFTSKSLAKKYAQKIANETSKYTLVWTSGKDFGKDFQVQPSRKKNPPINKWIPAKAVRFLKGGITQILK